MLGHQFGAFLSHRFSQNVGAAQRKPRQDGGDLHYLFLIDHDTVGTLKDGLELVEVAVNRGPALFPVDEGVHHAAVERPRAVERDHGDQIFKRARGELPEIFADSPALELKNAGGAGLGYQLVSFRVVQGEHFHVDLFPGLADQLSLSDRSR